MEFGLVRQVTPDVMATTQFIIELSDRMENFFLKKNYGDSVVSLIIGVICVSETFATSDIEQPLSFRKRMKAIEYDVVLDYEVAKKETKKNLIQFLLEIIINSIEERKINKIKNFHSDEFLVDLKKYYYIEIGEKF